jgi:hypothetical protein
MLGIAPNTVKRARDWIRGNRQPLPHWGADQKLTIPIKSYIAVYTLANPETSGKEMALLVKQMFNVSLCASTINIFRHSVNFKYAARLRSLPLTDADKMKHLSGMM